MSYRAPLEEFDCLLTHVIGWEEVTQTGRFADAEGDVATAILSEAGRMCEEVLAPLQRVGDTHPARLENGVVRTSPGFPEGYRAIADGGWVGISADPKYGGMGLPVTLATAVNEMIAGACLAIQLAPMMSQGQIEALEHHASDEIKARFLPKLISGAWNGTMNLTEPQAGSDVGALSTKAEDNGDGTFAITGQKIYISWGDHDCTENICHLVLAQYEGATGWIIGAPGGGMRAIFTMMNNARLGVGGQGIGVAEAATQHAVHYASERKQGRVARQSSTGAIIDHADVRRMLASMKADTFAARAIALMCAKAIDMETATGDPAWSARAAFLTPIAKSFGTETGMRVAELGVQVHGGMGFIEETGAAQFSRDVRVTAIYEGTNGIQAMDLVARKLSDGGEAAFALLDEMEDTIESARAALPDLAEPVWQACESLRETTEWMCAQDNLDTRFAGAHAYLMGFARVLGGYAHLKAAQAARDSRTAMARVYIHRLLPQYTGYLAEATAGDGALFDLSFEDLAS